MNTLSPVTGDQQKPAYLTQRHQRNNSTKGGARILQWWYRISSPPEPDASASFQERELFRRGRTGSQISIYLFLLIFISYPAALAGSNSLLIAILTVNLFSLVIALVLNRLKMVNIAGILVVLSVIASPIANILTTPGGVNTSALPIFGLLVLPLMCAASFLPPAWVFVVAAGNCLFTLYALSLMPNSGELHEVLKVAFPGIFTPIVLSQGIVAIVAFLWVRGAKLAILRADRAEEIAALEQREIEQQQLQIEQKQQLDEDIQLILQTHVEVARGNFSARAPLGKENILWRIAYSLNNLLARLQSYSQMQEQYQRLQEENYRLHSSLQSNVTTQNELQRTREATNRLVEVLKQSKDGYIIPISSLHTGTVIDTIADELFRSTKAKNS
jgi:hypothetical protein